MSGLAIIEQKSVDFNGSQLLAVKASDGKIYAGVKWICIGLGFDERKQRAEVERMARDVVLTKGIQKIGLPTAGGIQEVTCIELDFLPLWLAKINANIINAAEVQKKLIQYQLKAKDVLAEAFIRPQFHIPQNLAEALRLAADLAEENERMRPKAEMHDVFLSGDNYQAMGVVAKALGLGRNRLFEVLREKRILMGGNVPYQEYIDRGYFVVKEKPITMGEAVINKPQTYATSKGVDFIGRMLRAQ